MDDLKICISGLSGSGKNSVGEKVAQKLSFRLVNPTFKTIAAKQKMSLLDFHKKAEHEHSIDKNFDARLISEAKGGSCVVTTWLGPWMIKDADMRVWLYAPSPARAARVAKRDGMNLEEAAKHIAERDESNRMRYLDIYRIDICDHTGFDLVINTEKYLPEESSEIIAAAAKTKLGKGIQKATEGATRSAGKRQDRGPTVVSKGAAKKKATGKKKKRK